VDEAEAGSSVHECDAPWTWVMQRRRGIECQSVVPDAAQYTGLWF
jgi:hypothetical protein